MGKVHWNLREQTTFIYVVLSTDAVLRGRLHRGKVLIFVTTNRAYKQRVRDLMDSSPLTLSYVDAKQLIDAHFDYLDGRSERSPLSETVPDVFEQCTSDVTVEMLERMHFALQDGALFVGMSRQERESVEFAIERATAEVHVRDVRTDEPVGLARVMARLVAEFETVANLRDFLLRGYVYVLTGHTLSSTDEDSLPNGVPEVVDAYRQLSNAYIFQLAAMLITTSTWSAELDAYVGFGAHPCNEGTMLTKAGRLYFGLYEDCEYVETSQIEQMAQRLRQRSLI